VYPEVRFSGGVSIAVRLCSHRVTISIIVIVGMGIRGVTGVHAVARCRRQAPRAHRFFFRLFICCM
jgi:hypothetical protein